MGVQTAPSPSSNFIGSTMRIAIGSICCGISCGDEAILRNLEPRYRRFFTDREPDISIELSGSEELSPAELTSALAETRFVHENNTFRTSSLIMSGRYDLARGTIAITGDKNLANPDLPVNHLNRLLALGYYSACKIRHGGNPPAYLVHCCAIIRDGRAWLFAGPSGTGKSTVGQLCGDRYGRVINDEMVLVSREPGDDGRLTVEGAPILGEAPDRLRTVAPLGGVFLLKQSQRTAVSELERTEAFLRFMRQVITPAYIGQKDKRTIYSQIAEFSDTVTRFAPFFELEFTLGAGPLWQAVSNVEKSLGKGEHNRGNKDE